MTNDVTAIGVQGFCDNNINLAANCEMGGGGDGVKFYQKLLDVIFGQPIGPM